MKKTIIFILALVLPLGNILAAEEGNWNVGVTTGFMTTTAGGFSSVDPINVGLVAGYRFPSYSNWSVEGVYTITRTDGESAEQIGFVNDNSFIPHSWEINTWGMYGAFRSSGDWYFKAKAGFSGQDITILANTGEISDKRTGLSFGIGTGWNIGKFAVEIDYTYLDEDVDFVGLSLLRWF